MSVNSPTTTDPTPSQSSEETSKVSLLDQGNVSFDICGRAVALETRRPCSNSSAATTGAAPLLYDASVSVSSTESYHRHVRGDGHSLHHTVPMDYWTVTRQDIQNLRHAVRSGVRDGSIRPTECDTFDVLDNKHGPCIHTVVAQFIKPVTYIAGDQSWALMRNPSGSKCDLFVTHGWAEGIYEFIDKVLNSWPRGAKHAYCCMLSNPQNLDIEDLIASPSESPFALALASATHMLVVPNRIESIYTRIWCAYEAFLGYKWHKVIVVASSPIDFFRVQLLLISMLFLLSAGLAYCGPFSRKQISQTPFFNCLPCVMVFAISLVQVLPPGIPFRLCNYVGICACGLFIGLWSENTFASRLSKEMSKYVIRGVLLVLVPCYIASEADRMMLSEAGREAVQLHTGFTGHVRDAKSSVEKDRIAILNELASNEEEAAVDDAIDVLLRAGMSTVSLRKASQHGVNIESAGHVRISLAVFGYGYTTWSAWDLVLDGWYCGGVVFDYPLTLGESNMVLALGIILMALNCACVCILPALQKDSRAFASNAVFKAHLAGIPLQTLIELSVPTPSLSYIAVASMDVFLALVTLCCSAAGAGRVSSMPVVGPPLTRFILASTCRDLCCPCCAAARQGDEGCVGSSVELTSVEKT